MVTSNLPYDLLARIFDYLEDEGMCDQTELVCRSFAEEKRRRLWKKLIIVFHPHEKVTIKNVHRECILDFRAIPTEIQSNLTPADKFIEILLSFFAHKQYLTYVKVVFDSRYRKPLAIFFKYFVLLWAHTSLNRLDIEFGYKGHNEALRVLDIAKQFEPSVNRIFITLREKRRLNRAFSAASLVKYLQRHYSSDVIFEMDLDQRCINNNDYILSLFGPFMRTMYLTVSRRLPSKIMIYPNTSNLDIRVPYRPPHLIIPYTIKSIVIDNSITGFGASIQMPRGQLELLVILHSHDRPAKRVRIDVPKIQKLAIVGTITHHDLWMSDFVGALRSGQAIESLYIGQLDEDLLTHWHRDIVITPLRHRDHERFGIETAPLPGATGPGISLDPLFRTIHSQEIQIKEMLLGYYYTSLMDIARTINSAVDCVAGIQKLNVWNPSKSCVTSDAIKQCAIFDHVHTNLFRVDFTKLQEIRELMLIIQAYEDNFCYNRH
ncbi:hypothetical protein TRVA0_013S01794 [Trichomonascus vanleenenianus]|uniref:uncharacterized protein n=1 Tax=Trichomonascus vanleenenianus TaxID=2268995 RepID=UPI003ECA3AD8